jgi:hypothetical protein
VSEGGDELAPTTSVGGPTFWAPDGPAQSSANTGWGTPQEVIDRVLKVGGVGLDPASNAESIVPASIKWSGPSGDGLDGLSLPWHVLMKGSEPDSLVYVNPPYGRGITGPWVEKMDRESRRGVEIIALLPARTDTAWFQLALRGAQALCLWSGRLTFLGAPSSAPFPSAIVYWGPRVRRFESAFQDAGIVVRL